jgi:hypothetical protein
MNPKRLFHIYDNTGKYEYKQSIAQKDNLIALLERMKSNFNINVIIGQV